MGSTRFGGGGVTVAERNILTSLEQRLQLPQDVRDRDVRALARRGWIREAEPGVWWLTEAGDDALAERRAWEGRSARRQGLVTSTDTTQARKRRGPVSPASSVQRASARASGCIVGGVAETGCDGPVQPAHLVDRSLGGCDDARCVVGLCYRHHEEYDAHRLDLLSHLEPWHRDRVAHAVMHVGLVAALERLTGDRWAPVAAREAA